MTTIPMGVNQSTRSPLNVESTVFLTIYHAVRKYYIYHACVIYSDLICKL